MNCGQTISDTCSTAEFWLDRTDDGTLCSSLATFMITTSLTTMASSLSKNMVKGLNALRCAISAGGVNVYNLVAALYFAARQFGQEGELQTYLNEYWPYA